MNDNDRSRGHELRAGGRYVGEREARPQKKNKTGKARHEREETDSKNTEQDED